MTDVNKNIENNQEENQNREECNKKWWKKLLGLKPTYRLLFICFLLLVFSIVTIVIFNKKNNANVKDTKYKFTKIGKTNSMYHNGSNDVFAIGDNKYIIFGAENKTRMEKYSTIPFPEKLVHIEIFDYTTKKIKEVTPPILYPIVDCVQLKNGNIFFIGKTVDLKSYFAIFDINTFEIKELGLEKNLIDSTENSLYQLANGDVLIYIGCSNKAPYLSDSLYLFDSNNLNFKKVAELKIKRVSYSVIQLNDTDILVVGGAIPSKYYYKEKLLDIELCNIKTTKCKILNAKLSQKKLYPYLFKDKNGNILIFPSIIDEDKTIDLYDVKSDTLKTVGYIDRYYDYGNEEIEKRIDNYDKITGIMGANFVQLNDGNILITGGCSGISIIITRSDAYIYDISKNKLMKIDDMGYRRLNHLTKVLNDGNVLFLGLRQKYIQIFTTK